MVTKAGHLTYTVKDVVVGTDDIDLTSSPEAYRNIELISGDVRFVNGNDVQIIRLTTNINRKTEEAVNTLSDINGDGVINGTDVQIVRLTSNINKSKSDCTFDFAD